MDLYIGAHDIFSAAVEVERIAFNGDANLRRTGSYYLATLPDSEGDYTIEASAPGFQPVSETVHWDPRRRTVTVADGALHLESPPVGFPEGPGDLACWVRMVRLKDESGSELYRTLLTNMAAHPGPAQEGLILETTALVQRGPQLASRSYELPAQLGRFLVFRRALAAGGGQRSATATATAAAAGIRVSGPSASGSPQGVAVWLPPALVADLEAGRVPPGPLNYHVCFHPHPDPSYRHSDPFRADSPVDRSQPSWAVYGRNSYQNLIIGYLFWNHRLAVQHAITGRRAILVFPLGDRTGEHGEARSTRELHRIVREVGYLVTRSLSGRLPNTLDVGRVALSGYSAGMSAAVDVLGSRHGTPDDRFLRNNVREVYDLDGHVPGVDVASVVQAWASRAPGAMLRSYRSLSSTLPHELLDRYHMGRARQVDGFSEFHGTSESAGLTVSLLWAEAAAWGNALPQMRTDQGQLVHRGGDDAHHWISPQVVMHALSMGEL